MSVSQSTGQVARLLGVAEPRLNDLVRRGKIHPTPRVIVGRRVWLPFHVLQAAKELHVELPTGSAIQADGTGGVA